MSLTRSGATVDDVRVDRDHRAVRQALARRARVAVEEVLADQRLRAGLAGGVGAQVAEAVLGDAEADLRAQRALVELHVGDRPRAHAGDLQVAALDQAEGVVELDPVLGLLVRADAREAVGGEAGGGGDRDDDEGGDEDRASRQLPGSVWLGSQL